MEECPSQALVKISFLSASRKFVTRKVDSIVYVRSARTSCFRDASTHRTLWLFPLLLKLVSVSFVDGRGYSVSNHQGQGHMHPPRERYIIWNFRLHVKRRRFLWIAQNMFGKLTEKRLVILQKKKRRWYQQRFFF